MPRETVGPSTPNEPFVVRVGWAQDREVQVGIETVSNRSIYWQLLEGHAEELGATVRRLTVEAARSPMASDEEVGRNLLNALDAAGMCYSGLWTIFGREECNRLIRLLRRARDSAFGRDE